MRRILNTAADLDKLHRSCNTYTDVPKSYPCLALGTWTESGNENRYHYQFVPLLQEFPGCAYTLDEGRIYD